MNSRQKIPEILKRLKKEYPSAKTALVFKSPFELLVATVLSAQATDVLVNKVTESLFKKYRTIRDYADAPLDSLRKDVRSVNFYKTKAAHIQAAARILMEHFHGKVPPTMEELITLPGVARKTANIILSGAFGIHEGIAVDTHVKRLAKRLALTQHDNPVKVEKDLMEITPQKEWGNISHLLILHGRRVCPARNPKHEICALSDICPSH